MLSITISSSSISVLELEKNFLGKISIKGEGKQTFEEGADWKEKILPIIKNKHVVFSIPDKEVFLYRFEISKDLSKDVLTATIFEKVKEAVPVNPSELICDVSIIKRELEEKHHVLFAGVTKKTLEPFYDIWVNGGVKSLIIVPASLSLFEVLKHTIGIGEIILYADIQKSSAALTFFDSFGPVMNLSEAIKRPSLVGESKKAIDHFAEKYKKDVKTILIGGEYAHEVNLEDMKKETGVSVMTAENISHDALLDLGIKVDIQNERLELFMEPLGGGLLGLQKESLNLGSKEKMLQLKQYMLEAKVAATKDEVTTQTPPPSSKAKDMNLSKPSFSKRLRFSPPNPKFLIALVVIVFLIAGVVYGYTSFTKNNAIPSLTVVESPTPTITPTPTIILKRSDLKIQVQNGSGTPGLAGKVSDALKEKGYTDLEAKNADSFTYEGTTIQLKKDKSNYKDLLVSDLKDDYPVSSQEVLEEDSKFDVVIIIGK